MIISLPDLRTEAFKRWHEENKCDHAHCPNGCEHPQPFATSNGITLYCGRCWFKDDEWVEMVPCNPQTCKD